MGAGTVLSPSLCLPTAVAPTRFTEEPEDQTVVAGQRIVLSCVVLNYSGIVQWTKDGLALGMGQGLKGSSVCPPHPSPSLRVRPLPSLMERPGLTTCPLPPCDFSVATVPDHRHGRLGPIQPGDHGRGALRRCTVRVPGHRGGAALPPGQADSAE